MSNPNPNPEPQVRMSGALVVNAANDLRQIGAPPLRRGLHREARTSPDRGPSPSSAGLSFAELPALKMRVECTVSWGTLPLPLQDKHSADSGPRATLTR